MIKFRQFLLAAVTFATACTCTSKPDPGPSGPEDDTVPVTAVNVTRTGLELKAGEGFRLGARISPKNATNPQVTWSSDNEAVATVGRDDGQVKAIAEGKAVITVTTVDGGFTDTCPVTVKGGDTPPPPDPTDPGTPAAFGAVPTSGQLAWQRQELLMFYHYGQATFSGWDGENPTCNGKTWSENLLLQNYKPGTIDADQWVKTARDNGFGEVIITAKHHDGFCLWDNPESTTDVANAGCSNHTDVVKALRDACDKYGVNLGIYLSPWDRMIEVSEKSTAEYERMYKSALKDLMTRYAPVVEMWFDGNHAGNFDWPAVNQVVFDVNPECVIFSNGGPGCRWVGNEAGVAGETDWATLDIQGRGLSPSNLSGNYEAYLGSGDKGAASWCPAESDFSIQQIGDHNGWFYGANDSRKTARELMDLYYKSVGRNSVFLMNVPPSDKGVIDAREVKVIQEFTKMREAVFAANLADGATATATSVRGDNPDKYGPARMLDGNYDTYFATDDAVKAVDIEFELAGGKTFNRVMLQEYIPLGQRVESFDILVRVNGTWKSWGDGTKSTIGHKRIVLGNRVTADAVRISVKSSLACPVLNGFGLYNDTVSGL
ncbi:MAG: alpha-L-fucosidase [Bacteroidales bacterium]|nr:alpha-L-fucosidase [Bacteroidales bacterium]